MNIKEIESVVALFERSSLAKLEYCEKEQRILLEKTLTGTVVPGQYVFAGSGGKPRDSEAAADGGESGGVIVRAPVVGTLYRAKDQESKPFVEQGDSVSAGAVLCLIEAMKMYSEIESPCDGVVKEILFADGSLAEYDMPLFVIEAK